MQIVILFGLMGLMSATVALLFGVGLIGALVFWAVAGPISVGLAYAQFVAREAEAESPMPSAETI